jgi:hypothetical protein
VNHITKLWVPILIVIGLIIQVDSAAAKPSILSKRAVINQPVRTEKELIEKADLIVYGRYDTAQQVIPTTRRVSGGMLVNYIQTFHVIESFKGPANRIIRIVATGVDPLPKPDSRLNITYPGPLEEGVYICFLQRIPGKSLYHVIGGWQGVYPVHQGRTISLVEAGFTGLGQLTPEQFKEKVASEQ